MIDLRRVACCVITKEATYPPSILEHLSAFPFAERIMLTECDSPHRKHDAFARVTAEWIYYQDDDAICPVALLAARAEPGMITCAMKPFHLEKYADSRIALLGWGCLFERSRLAVLDRYRAAYGEDALYRRETERIFTYLDYPQQRLDLPIEDLPSAFAPDRLSAQPDHYDYIPQVEARCAPLVGLRLITCVRCKTPLSADEASWLARPRIGTHGREARALCDGCAELDRLASCGAEGPVGESGVQL